MIVARDGAHTGQSAYARLNRVPEWQSQFKCGVKMDRFPAAAMVSKRCWSVVMRRRLGRVGMDSAFKFR